MPIQILMPALSPTMETGKLAKWLIKEGDTVTSGKIIAEIETDKTTMDVEAVEEGTVGRILVAEGTEDIAVNAPIAVLLAEGEDEAVLDKPLPTATASASLSLTTEAPAPSAASPAPAANGHNERVLASPVARRLASEKELDLATIAGSGPHGRIVRSDVEAAAARFPCISSAMVPTVPSVSGPRRGGTQKYDCCSVGSPASLAISSAPGPTTMLSGLLCIRCLAARTGLRTLRNVVTAPKSRVCPSIMAASIVTSSVSKAMEPRPAL